MSKSVASQKVTFKKQDGCSPVRQGGVFNLCSPLQFSMKPGVEREINLGLTCDHVVQLVQNHNLQASGIVLLDNSQTVFDVGQALVVKLKNVGREEVMFERTQTLVRAVVIDNSLVELVVE